MAAHRGHEQAVHGSLGGLEQVGRLGRVEATPARRHRELVVEGRTEAQKAFDRLAEREAERCGNAAVLVGRHGSFVQMLIRRPKVGCVQVSQETRGKELATFPKEDALVISKGKDPGKFRRCLPARTAIGAGDAARGQLRATEGGAPGTIGWEQALERAP